MLDSVHKMLNAETDEEIHSIIYQELTKQIHEITKEDLPDLMQVLAEKMKTDYFKDSNVFWCLAHYKHSGALLNTLIKKVLESDDSTCLLTLIQGLAQKSYEAQPKNFW